MYVTRISQSKDEFLHNTTHNANALWTVLIDCLHCFVWSVPNEYNWTCNYQCIYAYYELIAVAELVMPSCISLHIKIILDIPVQKIDSQP